MRKTIFVVTLCGKSYKDSRILNCMMNKVYADTDLLIINRGPVSLQFDKDFIHTLGFFFNSIDIKESIKDLPLGEVFNHVIKKNGDCERFIFFDDDSILKKEYIKKLDQFYDDGVDLQIPNICGRLDSKIHCPIVNEAVCKIPDGTKINLGDRVKSIGLGLVIYRSLINKFSSINIDVFNSDFTLDGCDNNFFSRIDFIKAQEIEVEIQVVNTLNYSSCTSYGLLKKWRIFYRLRGGLLSERTDRFRY